ncbi:MAG: HAMP domain-containing protein [Thiolinea sp.]
MLFYRFFIALLLVSLIPVTANLYQLWQSQINTKNHVERELISTAERIVADVNHWVELNLRSSALITKTQEIQSMDPEQQIPLLKATDNTFEWSYAAFTTDLEGNAVARSDGKPLKFYGDREYVKAILSGENVGQQVLISRVNGKPALCLSVPINKDEQLTGTLVQCSKLVNISENVASVLIGKTGYARLMDSKLRLIAHGDTEQTMEELKDLSDDPITALGVSSTPVISTINDKKIVSYSLTTELGWRLTVTQDYDDAYAIIEKSKREAIIAGIALLLGIGLLSILLSNNISRPIRKLSDVAETYSKGELDMDIPGTNRRDEIGDLAKAIERLGSGLKVIVKHYT